MSLDDLWNDWFDEEVCLNSFYWSLTIQVDARLETLKEDVEDYDVKHETKFIEVRCV
jgi:hypothetical protein